MLVAKHFLACISKDAVGFETKVQVTLGGELFECTGLQVTEQNFLKVYPYVKWSEKTIPADIGKVG